MWLDELAHTNPLWIHPSHAAEFRVRTGDLVRVATAAGHFVVKVWVTEGIRPGVVACSHHMGRWRPEGQPGHRLNTATAALERDGSRWSLRPSTAGGPFQSADPDTLRVWWTEVGVHQNLTHPVHPDPISGQHCWHQAVRVSPAGPEDRHGDVHVDTAKMREIYRDWLAKTRAADRVSPTGDRRPFWLIRPLRPGREAFRLTTGDGDGAPTGSRRPRRASG